MSQFNLAAVKKRMQVRSVVAVSIEADRVAIDVVRREERTNRTIKSFALPVGVDAVVADPEKWGKELASLLTAEGVRERRCVVCVPAHWALTTSTDVPGIADEDLRGYLELRAEREFPIAVADLRLAHCAYQLPDGVQRATLAGVPAKRLEAVDRFIAAAGGKSASISLGLDHCLPTQDLPAALHFVANGNQVDLVIAAGGGIVALRSLAGLNGTAEFDAASFTREVRITLGRLPEPLRQQVAEARFSGTPTTAETLCVEIRQHLHRMGIESRVMRPTGAAPGTRPGVAREAAEHHLMQQPVAFEFLAPQVNRWSAVQKRFDTKKRRWLIIAGVAALLLPILIFFVRSRIESSLESDWTGMRRKVADLESLQLRIRQFRAWFEPTPQNLHILESLVTAFPETGEVWAKSMQITDGSKVTCTGLARSQAALLAMLERLRARKDVSGVQVVNVRGENPIQFSIIYKWGTSDGK